MIQDLTVALRTLIKKPGYAFSVILTLALGIGASATMFSLVDAALLRPLPFQHPDRLVMLTGVAGPQRSPRGGSFPEIADWRALNTTLVDVALYDEMSLNLRIGSEAVRVEAEMVSASYFPLLGVSAALGRTFLPDEDTTPDRHLVAVVSGRFWHERLGSNPSVLQHTLLLNDRSFQIVGVMPDGFAGISFDTDVWVPSMMVSLTGATTLVKSRGSRWLGAVGRLKDTVNLARAQQDLTRVAALLEQQYPDFNRQRGVDVDELRQALLGGVETQVVSLFAAVLLFLGVACANAAGLQLVRATARRREFAVRLALGARRWHVLRQLLMESFLLSLAAGTLGALGAAWSTSAAVALMPVGALPPHVQPFVDPRTLAFTLGVSLIVGVLVAVLPAFAASRSNLADVIKQGGRAIDVGLGAIRRPSAQQLLVVSEIAVAMVLLTVAGLVLRSLEQQTRVNLGFEPNGATVARVTLPTSRYGVDQRIEFVERLESRLRSIPGVASVAIGSDLPLAGSVSASNNLLPDNAAAQPDAALRYFRHFVTPGFFTALGIPLVSGRTFTWQDRGGAPLVAIVSEAAADRIWGRGNGLGRRFRLGANGPSVEVIGVAATARFRDLSTDLSAAGAEPDVYFPYGQRTDPDLQIVVRSTAGTPVGVASLQQAVAELDRGLPVYQAQRFEEVVRQQTSTARFVSALLTIFSAGALLLAAIGLYGLIAYVVALSRREIAIRLALGAGRARVAALIVRNGMVLVVAGVVAGAAGAFAAGRAIQAQLFRTDSGDPVIYAIVAALLLVVTFVASLVPTRLAVRVDPQAALRAD
jgi:putative ABC transport system permease protein